MPLASRRQFRIATAAAAVAACAALGLGIWAASLSSQLGEERDARLAAEALSVLADSEASHVALDGTDGSLVVAPSGGGARPARPGAAAGGQLLHRLGEP